MTKEITIIFKINFTADKIIYNKKGICIKYIVYDVME